MIDPILRFRRYPTQRQAAPKPPPPQRFPVALEDASRHVRVALRPEIATAVFFPAKARRDDQLGQENHMACDAMLNIAAILTVSMSSRCRQLISAIIIAANRAGERVPPLLVLEPRGGWFQRT